MENVTPAVQNNPLTESAMLSGFVGVVLFIFISLFIILLYFFIFKDHFFPKFKIYGLVLAILSLGLVSSQIGSQFYHSLLAEQELKITSSEIVNQGNLILVNFSTNKASVGYLKYRLSDWKDYQFVFPSPPSERKTLHSLTIDNSSFGNPEIIIMADGKAFDTKGNPL